MEPPQRTLSEEVESLAAAIAAIRIASDEGDEIVDALPPENPPPPPLENPHVGAWWDRIVNLVVTEAPRWFRYLIGADRNELVGVAEEALQNAGDAPPPANPPIIAWWHRLMNLVVISEGTRWFRYLTGADRNEVVGDVEETPQNAVEVIGDDLPPENPLLPENAALGVDAEDPISNWRRFTDWWDRIMIVVVMSETTSWILYLIGVGSWATALYFIFRVRRAFMCVMGFLLFSLLFLIGKAYRVCILQMRTVQRWINAFFSIIVVIVALFIAKYFPQSASAEAISRFIGGFCFGTVGFCALLQAIQLPTDFGSYMVVAVLPLQSVFTYFTDGFRLWYIWAGLLLLVFVIVRTHLDTYVDRVNRT